MIAFVGVVVSVLVVVVRHCHSPYHRNIWVTYFVAHFENPVALGATKTDALDRVQKSYLASPCLLDAISSMLFWHHGYDSYYIHVRHSVFYFVGLTSLQLCTM